MRLLILPFDEQAELIESEILELESSSVDEIKSNLKSIMKGRLYQIEIYKKVTDNLQVQLGDIGAMIALAYDKERFGEHIEENPFEKVMNLMEQYLEKDGGSNLRKHYIEKEEERKRLEKEKYEKWKKTYDAKADKRKALPYYRIGIAVVITGVLFYFLTLLWTGDLTFLFKSTDIKKGVVTNVSLVNVPGGGYHQRVTYEFTFDGETYKNYFTADRFTGAQRVGDSIFVKFDMNNPHTSKYESKKN